MTAMTGEPLELAGWIVLAGLALLFVAQSRVLRSFSRPNLVARDAWPSLSVVIRNPMPDSSTRRLIAEVAASDYRGELEILLLADSQETEADSRTLTLASPQVRVVEASPENAGRLTWISSQSRGESIVILSPTLQIAPGLLERLVPASADTRDLVDALLPRLELHGTEIVHEPMLPWLRLTFGPVLARASRPEDAALCFARVDSEPTRSTQYLDGYDFLARPALEAPAFRRQIQSAVGDSLWNRSLATIMLLLLFTAPPFVALVTKSFPWVVAAVVSYWMRFRIAARTGEPVAGAFLHPFAAAATALMLLQRTSRVLEHN